MKSLYFSLCVFLTVSTTQQALGVEADSEMVSSVAKQICDKTVEVRKKEKRDTTFDPTSQIVLSTCKSVTGDSFKDCIEAVDKVASNSITKAKSATVKNDLGKKAIDLCIANAIIIAEDFFDFSAKILSVPKKTK